MGLSKTARRLKKYMTSMKTWRPECQDAVTMCARLMDQYDQLEVEFIEKSMKVYEVLETGATKKTAYVQTMETLRKDILSYLKELGLTPMAMKRLDQQNNLPESNVLADVLRRMDAG